MISMQPMDYATPPKPQSKLRRSIRQLVLAVRITIVGGFVAMVVLWLWAFALPAQLAMHRLEQRTPESKVLGKNPAQIIAAIGIPDDEAKFLNGDRDMIYADAGVCCRDGVAKNVVRWVK